MCEHSFWRTTVAVAVSLGKFVGATSFGLLSDKAGRKVSFMFGALFYIIGSLLTAFSPWYWLFLIGRVFLGSSSSGLFYGAFSLCMLELWATEILKFLSNSSIFFFANSDREHQHRLPIMDEHRIYNVISYWHDSAGNHGQFRASMATTAIVIDHSCIFARLLLLVSSLSLSPSSSFIMSHFYCAASWTNHHGGCWAKVAKRKPIKFCSIRKSTMCSQRKNDLDSMKPRKSE